MLLEKRLKWEKNPFFFPSSSPLSLLGRRSPPAAHLARAPPFSRPGVRGPAWPLSSPPFSLVFGPARRLRPSCSPFPGPRKPPRLGPLGWRAAQPPNGSPAPFACARGAVAQPPPPLRVGPACKPRGHLLFIPYPYDTPFLSPHCSRRSKPPPSHPFVRPRATVSPISSSSLVPPLSLVCGWRGRDARRPRRPRHPRPRRRFAPARLGLDAAATPASARPNPGPRPRPSPCVRGVARPALGHGAAARGPPVSSARSGVRSPRPAPSQASPPWHSPCAPVRSLRRGGSACPAWPLRAARLAGPLPWLGQRPSQPAPGLGVAAWRARDRPAQPARAAHPRRARRSRSQRVRDLRRGAFAAPARRRVPLAS
jgi:hypothetical protein